MARMRPPLPAPPPGPNQADMWQDPENDPYGDISARRQFDAHAMREFPHPSATDSGLEGPPDDLPGLDDAYGGEAVARMHLPSPDTMMSGLRGNMDYRHPDPKAHRQGDVYRAQAVQDYVNRQGIGRQNPIDQPGVQRPGMKTEDDYRQQFNGENPDFSPTKPRMPGLPEYDGKPVPGEMEEHNAAQQMSDEELLAEIQKQMDPNKPSFPRDLLNGKVDPQSDDSNAMAPFTGDYARDTKILDAARANPGPDLKQIEDMFKELHGDDEINDREMDPPTDERDMRSGRP